jgi:hypothetical protein
MSFKPPYSTASCAQPTTETKVKRTTTETIDEKTSNPDDFDDAVRILIGVEV